MKVRCLIFLSVGLMTLNFNLALAEDFDDWDFEDWDSDEEEMLDTGEGDFEVDEPEVSGSEFMGTVYMQEEFLANDLFKISVIVEDMASPVLGTAFHLGYDPSQVAFLKYEPGDFLERGGDPFYLVTNSQEKLIFGATLRKEDSFPLGEGRLVDFYFQILEKEKFAFKFSNGVVSSLDTVRQDLDYIEWKDLFLDSSNTSQLKGVFESDLGLEINSTSKQFRPGIVALIVGAVLLSTTLILFLRKQESKRTNLKKNLHSICQF